MERMSDAAISSRSHRPHAGRPIDCPGGIRARRRGAARHGGVLAASGLRDRRADPQAGRQCRRRGGGGRLRAGRDQPLLRQHRRGRLHDPAPGRRPRPLHQFPREGAGRRLGQHVPRRGRQREARREPVRLSRGRRAGHGGGPEPGRAQIRQAHAAPGDGAGDQARPRRLRAHARRHRHPRYHHQALPQRSGRGAHLPARRRLAAAAGRPAGAEGSRGDARETSPGTATRPSITAGSRRWSRRPRSRAAA